ncbi:MAG: hypothetical protein LBH98_03140 [Chitinispirillales bacterium]|jgi:hypothetical protein|nr:hypothetical protein [Chitinispirillales bacterium]
MSGMQTQSRVIDGKQVSITPLPFTQSIRFKFSLLKILGGNATELGKGFENYLTDSFVGIGQMLESVLKNVNAEVLDALLQVWLQNVKIDGKEMNDEGQKTLMFSGNMTFLYKVCAAVLEVNYSDVFQALRDRFLKQPTPEEKR